MQFLITNLQPYRAALILAASALTAVPLHAGERPEHATQSTGTEALGHEEGGAVRIDAATRKEFGIETSVAGPGSLFNLVRLPGEVRLNEDAVAHIVPRYAGIVTAVYGKLGDKVSAGDELAEIESSDTLVRFKLKSLVSGTIISRHIALGEVLETASEPFVVADLSSVWVDFSVYQKDIGLVANGQNVEVLAPHGLGTVRATISYVGPTMNESTRTALARAVIDNASGIWLPGMFVTGIVETDTKELPLVVPLSAIQTHEGADTVFVLDDDGFEPRKVVLGERDGTSVEIRDGLKAGEVYAATGAFHIKATLLKGSMGDGHGH